MNWTTSKRFRGKLSPEHDLCEHVEENNKLAFWEDAEMDSFGPVGIFISCKECRERDKEQQKEETNHCADCGGEFPNKELTSWTPYDFDPRDGDEVIHVCNGCKPKERHKKRVEDDRFLYHREFG